MGSPGVVAKKLSTLKETLEDGGTMNSWKVRYGEKSSLGLECPNKLGTSL